jgi:hypothetical protein
MDYCYCNIGFIVAIFWGGRVYSSVAEVRIPLAYDTVSSDTGYYPRTADTSDLLLSFIIVYHWPW